MHIFNWNSTFLLLSFVQKFKKNKKIKKRSKISIEPDIIDVEFQNCSILLKFENRL